MARGESLMESSWFWLLEMLKSARAGASEASQLANLSCNSFGDKNPGRKFRNHTHWKKKNGGRQIVCHENYVNLRFFILPCSLLLSSHKGWFSVILNQEASPCRWEKDKTVLTLQTLISISDTDYLWEKPYLASSCNRCGISPRLFRSKFPTVFSSMVRKIKSLKWDKVSLQPRPVIPRGLFSPQAVKIVLLYWNGLHKGLNKL